MHKVQGIRRGWCLLNWIICFGLKGNKLFLELYLCSELRCFEVQSNRNRDCFTSRCDLLCFVSWNQCLVPLSLFFCWDFFFFLWFCWGFFVDHSCEKIQDIDREQGCWNKCTQGAKLREFWRSILLFFTWIAENNCFSCHRMWIVLHNWLMSSSVFSSKN